VLYGRGLAGEVTSNCWRVLAGEARGDAVRAARQVRARALPLALLLTHPRPLAEDSPSDFVWGCRDPQGGYGGQNLLGLALM
jgi:predicted NAD-dependent protein-ADP-ribosyltransferase YbiA (DUF1768 family)